VAPGAALVAILSAPLARADFGSAAAALGKVLKVDGKRTRIVGVLPADFAFPNSMESPGGDRGFARNEVWLPFTLNAAQRADVNVLGGVGGNMLARLRPGATITQAEAQMDTVKPEIEAGQPKQTAALFGHSFYSTVAEIAFNH
ncbi:MAG: ABC transporter permease, partial [Terriglobales bacterium]